MDSYLGEFEQLVLLAATGLRDEAYGIAIRDRIAQQTARDVTVSAVYKALWRLEHKRLVEADLGVPTAVRGGRRKRIYRLTPAGRKALRASVAAVRQLARGLDDMAFE